MVKKTEAEVFTVKQAAWFLKVDPVTVQRELKAGRLPGAKVGRAWRIPIPELCRYLKGEPIRIWRTGDKVWVSEPCMETRELFKESSITIDQISVLDGGAAVGPEERG